MLYIILSQYFKISYLIGFSLLELKITVNTMLQLILSATCTYMNLRSIKFNIPWFKEVVTHGTGGRNKGVLIIFSIIIKI